MYKWNKYSVTQYNVDTRYFALISKWFLHKSKRYVYSIAGLYRDGNAHVLRWPQWHVWSADVELC
jgi:hypothetical protein